MSVTLRPLYWTNSTEMAYCHNCKQNTAQVEAHKIEGTIHRVERTCYKCGQWTRRQTRRT